MNTPNTPVSDEEFKQFVTPYLQEGSKQHSALLYPLKESNYAIYAVRRDYFDLMVRITNLSNKLRLLERDSSDFEKNIKASILNPNVSLMSLGSNLQKIYIYQKIKCDLERAFSECDGFILQNCFWYLNDAIGLVDGLVISSEFIQSVYADDKSIDVICAGDRAYTGGKLINVDQFLNDYRNDILMLPCKKTMGMGMMNPTMSTGTTMIGNPGMGMANPMMGTGNNGMDNNVIRNQFVFVLYPKTEEPDFALELFGTPLVLSKKTRESFYRL